MDVWDIYFSGLVSMAVHPGYNREGTKPLTLKDCGIIADEMIKERNKRGLDSSRSSSIGSGDVGTRREQTTGAKPGNGAGTNAISGTDEFHGASKGR